MSWWTSDDTTKSGTVTINTPSGPVTGTSTPHTGQIWLPDGSSVSTK